jgi:protein arginine kinase activator
MLCDICKKNNAVIRIQKFHDGKMNTINLCADCAEHHKEYEQIAFSDINISDVFENIKKITQNLKLQDFVSLKESVVINGKEYPAEILNTKCPNCGFSLGDIDKNSGRLGCAECYHIFEKEIMDTIENMHRCKIHTGKHPVGVPQEISKNLIDEKIAKLEVDLQEAVQREKYEQAALLRDEINLLKKSRSNVENE